MGDPKHDPTPMWPPTCLATPLTNCAPVESDDSPWEAGAYSYGTPQNLLRLQFSPGRRGAGPGGSAVCENTGVAMYVQQIARAAVITHRFISRSKKEGSAVIFELVGAQV